MRPRCFDRGMGIAYQAGILTKRGAICERCLVLARKDRLAGRNGHAKTMDTPTLRQRERVGAFAHHLAVREPFAVSNLT